MAAEDKSIILVTGGNAGIGFELVAQLLSDPSKHALLGSRSAEKGEAAVKEIQSRKQPGTVELLQLDVASDESISIAAKLVESKHGRLDALVNNAAIGWPPGSPAEQMTQAFQTNSTGPYLMVEAFAELLKKSKTTPRIINISSGGGSIARRLDPTSQTNRLGMWGVAYCASKAALNLLTAAQSVVYGEQGFKVFAVSPGFVASNLGPHNSIENGAQPANEAVGPIIKVLNGERDDEHAHFLTAAGQYPW